MPRPTNPDVRRRLVESGQVLIGKNGFSGSGVADITASAGVPKGSFYHYFDSKEAFAVELLDEYWKAIETKHASALFNEKDKPLDRLAKHFRSIAQDHRQQKFALGCLIGNLGLEISDEGGPAQIKLRAILKQWASLISICLHEAQSAGALDSEVEANELAAALIEAWEGAVMRAKIERSGAAYRRFDSLVLPRLLR